MTRATGPIQRTDEWYEARRHGITSTDIVAILGLSPYASEGDVARDKTGETREDESPARERAMRLGRAMEDLIRDEEQIEHAVPLRRVKRLITHPEIDWAITSLDFERVGERTIVEAKSSASRRWDDGLPEDVEVQVRWQMGVAQYPKAHVAALRFGSQLACFDVDHDQITFDRMLVIADDFRTRLAAGGPFAENKASMRRAFPLDNGETIVADAVLDDAVRNLIVTKQQIGRLCDQKDALEETIQNRMGPASLLQGIGYRVTWRRAKGWTETDWEGVAELMLDGYPAIGKEAIIGEYAREREGTRRFIVKEERL